MNDTVCSPLLFADLLARLVVTGPQRLGALGLQKTKGTTLPQAQKSSLKDNGITL